MKREINRLLAGILTAAMVVGISPVVATGDVILTEPVLIENGGASGNLLNEDDVQDLVKDNLIVDNEMHKDDVLIEESDTLMTIEESDTVDILESDIISESDISGSNPETASKNEVVDRTIDANNFPDEVFRGYISENYDTNHDGILSINEINAIKNIDLSSKSEVVSINGIKYFVSANNLNLSNTKIKNLPTSEISKLTVLTDISLNDMRELTGISLSGYKELKRVSAYKTAAGALNIANCPKLEVVDMHINPSLTAVNITGAGADELSAINLEFDFSNCNALRGVTIYSRSRVGRKVNLNMKGNMQELKAQGEPSVIFRTTNASNLPDSEYDNDVNIQCSKDSYLATNYLSVKPDYVTVYENNPGKPVNLSGLPDKYEIRTGVSENVVFTTTDINGNTVQYMDYTVSVEDESVAVIEDLNKYNEDGSFRIITKKGGHTRLLVVPTYNKEKKVIIPLWVVDDATGVNLECDREYVQKGSTTKFTYKISPDAAAHSLSFNVYAADDNKTPLLPSSGISISDTKVDDTAYVNVESSVAPGTKFTVVGTYALNTDKSGNPIYDALNFTVSKYMLDRSNVSMRVGENVTISLNDASNGKAAKAVYSSNDTSVVTVDSEGKLYGVAEGTTAIKVITPDKTVLYCDVTVINASVTGLKMNRSELRIRTGDVEHPISDKNLRTAKLELIFTPSSSAYEYFHEKDGSVASVNKIIITNSNSDALTVDMDSMHLKKTGVVEFNVIAADMVNENKTTVINASITPEVGSSLTASCNVIVSPTDSTKVPEGMNLWAIINNEKKLADISDSLSKNLIDKGMAANTYVFAEPSTDISVYEDLEHIDYKVVHTDNYSGEPIYDYVSVSTSCINGVSPIKVKKGSDYIDDAGVILKNDSVSLESQMTITGYNFNSVSPVTANMLAAKGYTIKYFVDKPEVATISGTSLTAKAEGVVNVKAIVEYNGKAIEGIKATTRKITVKDAGSKGTADIQVELIRKNATGTETVIGADGGVYIIEKKEGYSYFIKDKTEKAKDGSIFVIDYKSSDELVVKPEGKDKKTGYAVIKVSESGFANMTFTANDVVKSSKTIKIRVVDSSNVSVALNEDSLYYNPAMNNDSTVNMKKLFVYNGFSASISDVKLVKTKDGKDEVIPGYRVIKGTGNCFNINLDNATKSTKGYVKVKLVNNTIANTYYLPIKLNVKSSVPKVKLVQTKKVSTLYKNDNYNEYSGLINVAADGTKIVSVNLVDDGLNGKPAALYPLGYQGRIENVNNTSCVLPVRLKSSVFTKNNKAKVAVYLDGYRKPVEASITIAYEETKLNLNIKDGEILTYNSEVMPGNRIRICLINKATGKIEPLTSDNGQSLLQIFIAGTSTTHTRDGATLSLSGSGSSKYKISVDPYDYNYLIIAPNNSYTNSAKGDTLTVNVKCTNWNETWSFKAFKISSKDAGKAKLKIDKSSITMYEYATQAYNEAMTYSTGQVTIDGRNSSSKLLENIRITGANAKSTSQLNTTLKIGYDSETECILATYNGTNMPAVGSYKYNVVIPAGRSGLSKDIKTSLTVNVKNVTAKDESKIAKAKVSGKIDVLDIENSYCNVSSKFVKIPDSYKVISSELTGDAKELFDYKSDGTNGRIYFKDGVRGFKNKKYKVSIKYTLDIEGKEMVVTSEPVTLRFTESKPILKLSSDIVYVSKDCDKDISVILNAYNGYMKKLDIEKVIMVNPIDGISFDGIGNEGILKLNYSPDSSVKRGKTYTIKLKVYLKNRLGDSKVQTVSYKVMVKK